MDKINFDGLVMIRSTKVRGVFQNIIGELLVAYTRNCGGELYKKYKALGLIWGMTIMRAIGIKILVIEGD